MRNSEAKDKKARDATVIHAEQKRTPKRKFSVVVCDVKLKLLRIPICWLHRFLSVLTSLNGLFTELWELDREWEIIDLHNVMWKFPHCNFNSTCTHILALDWSLSQPVQALCDETRKCCAFHGAAYLVQVLYIYQFGDI